MSWKTFKEHFGITHIVQIRDGDLLIGSPYISDLAAISMDTGMIKKRESWLNDFLSKYYPNVSVATQGEIKALLDAEDTFAESIPVYTYEGLKILSKYCEEVGHPNVTHDGVLLYRNTFSINMDDVVEWAKSERKYRLESLRERIADRAKELDELLGTLRSLEKEEIIHE